jgi:hypothetical protein
LICAVPNWNVTSFALPPVSNQNMTRGPGVAGVVAGAQIETGSPANITLVPVAMVGHVPETAGSIVGVPPPVPTLPLEVDVPPDDPLEDPELEPLDPLLDELEVLVPLEELEKPDDPPFDPKPPPFEPLDDPPFEDASSPELDCPELDPAPLLPPELPPKMLPDGVGLLPQDAAIPINPIARTRFIACLLRGARSRVRSRRCAVKRARGAGASLQGSIISTMYCQRKLATAWAESFRRQRSDVNSR